jgi:hypothetical protein
MKRWLEAHAKALQALGALVTMLAAVAALIGVKVQIDASARQAREQSARDIYREFLNLSIARPELADPDYCALQGSAQEGAYENYLEYALYTAEQLHDVSPEWDATMLDHLAPHRTALCSGGDWGDDTPGVRALVAQFKARECKAVVEACAE